MASEQLMDCEVQVSNDPDNKFNSLASIEIEKKIGKGQFSEVFRAKSKDDGGIVALKKVQVPLPCTVIVAFPLW